MNLNLREKIEEDRIQQERYVSTTYTIPLVEKYGLRLNAAQIEKALGSPKDEESKIKGYSAFVREESNGFREIVNYLYVKKEYDEAYIMALIRAE